MRIRAFAPCRPARICRKSTYGGPVGGGALRFDPSRRYSPPSAIRIFHMPIMDILARPCEGRPRSRGDSLLHIERARTRPQALALPEPMRHAEYSGARRQSPREHRTRKAQGRSHAGLRSEGGWHPQKSSRSRFVEAGRSTIHRDSEHFVVA